MHAAIRMISGIASAGESEHRPTMDFVIRVGCGGFHRHCAECLPPRPERGADSFCAGMDFHARAGRRLEDGGPAQA